VVIIANFAPFDDCVTYDDSVEVKAHAFFVKHVGEL